MDQLEQMRINQAMRSRRRTTRTTDDVPDGGNGRLGHGSRADEIHHDVEGTAPAGISHLYCGG